MVSCHRHIQPFYKPIPAFARRAESTAITTLTAHNLHSKDVKQWWMRTPMAANSSESVSCFDNRLSIMTPLHVTPQHPSAEGNIRPQRHTHLVLEVPHDRQKAVRACAHILAFVAF